MAKRPATAKPIDSWPDMRVQCSCGAVTVIRWAGRRYEADDPKWKYGVDSKDDLESPLWH